MRAYRFCLLDKKEFDTGEAPKQFYSGRKIILEQNINKTPNTDNIHIEFDIQQLSNSEEKTMFSTATLSLYNVNRYWHNENAKNVINNAKIVLYAGVKATPIHYHQGLIDITGTCYAMNDYDILRKPIYEGFVKNAYPDMDGINTILRLNLVSESLNQELKGTAQLNIEQGVQWRPAVKQIIDEMINKEGLSLVCMIGKSSKESLEITESKINSVNINGIFSSSSKDGISICAFVQKAFNEIIYKDGNIIWIGESLDIITKPSQIISDKNLIGQPQMTGLKTISFNVPMTSKFSILQKIKLQLKGFVSINQMFYGENDLGYSPLNRGKDKMFEGEYQIIQIWHKGQSRNPDTEAWCTTIEAIELTNKK